MKIALFSAKSYDREFFERENREFNHEIAYFDAHLNEHTVKMAAGFDAVCVFPNDALDRFVIKTLAAQRIKLIALRCAGYNNVDLEAAREFGIQVVRVPAYSPYAVAEHAIAMMLTLNRKIHRAYNRVRESNFKLDGLMGFDMHGKTVGLVGTGRIGSVTANILKGFGCRILAYDPSPRLVYEEHGVHYVPLDELLHRSDIISLHCPLTPQTHHMINEAAIERMKPGAMLINTSRGGIIDTRAIIWGLKSGKIGSLGMDVYEEEEDIFFEDLSNQPMQDDVFARLLTFPNVLVTGHQAFFTREALESIAQTTLENIREVEKGLNCTNEIISVG